MEHSESGGARSDGAWPSLAGRLLWEQEVGGSSPPAPIWQRRYFLSRPGFQGVMVRARNATGAARALSARE